MALINTLREKAGKVLVFAVGLAILSFVLADLLGPNSMLAGGQGNDVGEIAGRKITYQDFQARIESMKNNYILNTGRTPSEAEMGSIRQQAWELLIVDIAFQDQYDELGITVPEEERVDMVQGRNIHPTLVQAFTNPQTGEFEKAQIVNFLQNFAQLPPQNQQQWIQMEKSIYQARNRVKYDNLFVQGNYVTDAEAQRRYYEENTTAEVKYLYVPFYAVSDSVVAVTDEELENYISEHKEEYKVEESRSIKYVSISIEPSAEDSASYRDELERLKSDFESVPSDSSFARLNTDFGAAYQQLNVSQLPQNLQSRYSDLEEGEVYGPYLENGIYKLFKVSEIVEDTIYAARASHILFKADPQNEEAKQQARQQAEETLRELKDGADFAQTARAKSEDSSAPRGGDLGWFTEGNMVGPFNDAVFDANKEGLVNEVIETQYGYHIITVTEPKTNRAFEIATIQREVVASDETRDEAFRKADYLAGMSEGLQGFLENAQKDSLQVFEAENIASDADGIGSLQDAREVVRWLFTDASVGDVSEVFELENAYVVAAMTAKIEAGTAPLSMVKNEVEAKVKNEKKAEKILEKLSGLSGTLEEKAEAYGADANVYSSTDLKLSMNSLPTAGIAPTAIGRAFGLEAGEVSEPIVADNGVLILQTIAINEAPEIADYSSYKSNLKRNADNQTSFQISQAIKEAAEIEDNRYKFF